MNTHQQDLEPSTTHPSKPGHHEIRLRIQTPRGLWTMHEPKDAPKRPEYKPSAWSAQVIEDARIVFKFVEKDRTNTLLRHREILQPERTLESYHIENETLLVLSVQGGNA